MSKSLLLLLRRTSPFRFLSKEDSEALAGKMLKLEAKAGTVIARQFDKQDKRVFILEEGLVSTYVRNAGKIEQINIIRPAHYFGERAALFHSLRKVEFKALEDSMCWVISGNDFLELLQSSAPFAQALGTSLRDQHGVFEPFDRFRSELEQGMLDGYIHLEKLLPLYRKLLPALHPLARDNRKIDFNALAYALHRLPENIYSTVNWLLSDELPDNFKSPDSLFTSIFSRGRRRNVWELMPGKNMALLRDGRADLMDIVTCLCAYYIESEKIRSRLKERPENTSILKSGEGSAPVLSFNEQEMLSFKELWGKKLNQNLFYILKQDNSCFLEIRRERDYYNSRKLDIWTRQISTAAKEVWHYHPRELPESKQVHIISSNSHSVMNCLNPCLQNLSSRILSWAEESGIVRDDNLWENKTDLVYALLPQFFKANPQLRFSLGWERENGIYRLTETVSTGIQVQLFDFAKIQDKAVDPDLPRLKKSADDCLIINIDYAFGEQAAEIIRNLIFLFGERIASINILGKAGALQGKRGDILIPRAFLDQKAHNIKPVPVLEEEILKNLETNFPNRVHSGNMLTVGGTLFQSAPMLYFYKYIWDCIGLEMEGIYYAGQINDLAQVNLIRGDIKQRYLYYVSDVPFKTAANLSTPMTAIEGVPPLYAITRELLKAILCSV